MASSVSVEGSAHSVPVASWRHTRHLVAIFVVLSASGLVLQGRSGGPSGSPGHGNLAVLYSSLIAGEWLLFGGVLAGLRSTGTRWQGLVGRTSSGWKHRAGDVLSGVLLCAGWLAVVSLARSYSAEDGASFRSLLPRGALETTLWTLLSLSAGFCEEITFRGYFQRQFEALTGRKGVALVMQSALFGIAHAYQGLPSALPIAGYGLLFGALALWRGNLRAGMLAHALTDLILGLGGR